MLDYRIQNIHILWFFSVFQSPPPKELHSTPLSLGISIIFLLGYPRISRVVIHANILCTVIKFSHSYSWLHIVDEDCKPSFGHTMYATYILCYIINRIFTRSWSKLLGQNMVDAGNFSDTFLMFLWQIYFYYFKYAMLHNKTMGYHSTKSDSVRQGSSIAQVLWAYM